MRTPGCRRIVSYVLEAALVAGILAGCSGTDNTKPASPPGGPEVRRGGTLVYATSQRLDGFNQLQPRSARLLLFNVMRQVWPGAFQRDADGRLVLNRDLFESVELTGTDPQTVVYRFNPNAVWSDGDPLDARDLVYLWRTAFTPGAKDVDGSDVAATTSSARGSIRDVITSDDWRTATVVFSRNYPDWKSLFLFIVPSHIAEVRGWNRGFDTFDPATVVSGGPFKVGSYRPDHDVTLVRNERYWGRPTNLDSVVIRFLPEGGQVLSAIKNREIDLAELLNPDVDSVGQARAVPGLTTVVHAQGRYNRMYFNFRNPLLASVDVRRAVTLALDRPAMLARTTGPLDPAQARIVNSRIYVPGEPGYRDVSGGRYDRRDLAGAIAVLEAAGFRRGADGVYVRGDNRLSLRMLPGGSSSLLVQAQLREAGIEVRLEGGPDSFTRGDFDLAISSRPTSSTEVAAQFTTGGAFNWGRYSNPEVDELVREADSELDEGRRLNLHARIDELLWNDLPTVPLEQVLGAIVYRDTFVNIVPDTGGGLFGNAHTWGLRT